MAGYKQQNVFLIVLKSGNMRSGCHHGQFCCGTFSKFPTTIFKLSPHVVETAPRELSELPFIKALIPSMRAPLLWPNYILKFPFLMPSQCWVGFQHIHFGRAQTFSPYRFYILFLDFFDKPILGKGTMATILYWILTKFRFSGTINSTSVNLVLFDGHRHLRKPA